MPIHRLLAGTIMFTALSGSPSAAQLRARVLDSVARTPLIDVPVLVVRAGATDTIRTATDDSGYFVTGAIPAGMYTVIVRRDGYALSETHVDVPAGRSVTLPAILLDPEAIALDPIAVAGQRDRLADPTTVGFARASHAIAGERLKQMEHHGIRPLNALRELNGVRVRQWQSPGGQPRWCVESVRKMASLGGTGLDCEPVVLVWDGRIVPDIERTLRSLDLTQLESIEYVPPVDAAFRYGSDAAAVGAIAVWSRGLGPHRSSSR